MSNHTVPAAAGGIPITRRALFSTGSTLAAIGAVGMLASQCIPTDALATPLAIAEPDPVFAAIARHSAARFDLNTFESRGLDWRTVNEAEHAAWNDFADTHPTTPAGLAAMTSYVLHSPAGYEDEDCMRRALASIAVCTTRFAIQQPGGRV